jgi:hypothetical protein
LQSIWKKGERAGQEMKVDACTEEREIALKKKEIIFLVQTIKTKLKRIVWIVVAIL